MFSCAGQCESLAVPKSLVRLYLHAHIPVPDPGYTSEHYTSPNFFFFLFSQLIKKKVDKKIAPTSYGHIVAMRASGILLTPIIVKYTNTFETYTRRTPTTASSPSNMINKLETHLQQPTGILVLTDVIG